MDKIKGWETKFMRRLFRFKKKEEETGVGYLMRTARAARTLWVKMKLPTLSEMIAENRWRVMGWACDSRQNVVLKTLKGVFAWRSTLWWQNLQAFKMKEVGNM